MVTLQSRILDISFESDVINTQASVQATGGDPRGEQIRILCHCDHCMCTTRDVQCIKNLLNVDLYCRMYASSMLHARIQPVACLIREICFLLKYLFVCTVDFTRVALIRKTHGLSIGTVTFDLG